METNSKDSLLPAYDDLPITKEGARSGWHQFGPSDSLGRLNLIDREATRRGVASIETGDVFSLDLPSDFISPPLFSRGAGRRTTIQVRPGESLDDVHDNYFPQSASQWDAIGHIAYTPGVFYNGASTKDVLSGSRNTIDFVAEKGIATRAIVIDVAPYVEGCGGAGKAVEVPETALAAALEKTRAQPEPGDLLLMHTGWLDWYGQQDPDVRRTISRREMLTSPGVAHSEAVARWLWNAGFAAVAGDNPSFEVWPPNESADAGPFGFLHRVLLGQLGISIGELWWLREVVATCRADDRWTGMLTSAPLKARGGIGSPANALFIR